MNISMEQLRYKEVVSLADGTRFGYVGDLEVDTDLIEQRIYERQALLCRYRYLLARARELGLHTILKKYQPLG